LPAPIIDTFFFMAKIHYKESGNRMARNEAALSRQNEYGRLTNRLILDIKRPTDDKRENMVTGKRQYSRCDFSQIIVYSLPPHSDKKVSTGLLHDFSYSGVCIITQHPLQEGQEILIKSGLIDSITALVRWCDATGNSTYKVGLEFKR
jgi:hypothetical protein